MLKNFLLALLEDARVLALVLGVTLITLADTKVIHYGTFRLELWGGGPTRTVFLAIGSLLVLLSSSGIILKSFYTPLARLIATYRNGIKITFPKDSQTIYGEFAVRGEFKRQPKGKDVRAFVASTHDKRIWPQGPVVFNGKNKTWDCMVNLWEHPKPDAYIFVAELGEDSIALCDYYGVVGSTAQWVPIRQLASDALEYDRVRVENGCPAKTVSA